ncbi:uncharacterized protein TNCT_433111 [Trichonephila clavata]|uniref:Uncharacterized protein n=1 Tax=Trichonephila clavata TaxID=2740835 RepID=A0A8X6HNP2_TRICU|nr:uncharacterized protein TNCT_433111 [Trichonephila clavata]
MPVQNDHGSMVPKLLEVKEGEKVFGEINKFIKKPSSVCNKGMERLRKSWKTVLLSLLSLVIVIKPQVMSLQIRPQTCYNSMGDVGTCMFVWECIKTEGKHLGTCADGFLFGSCCAHSDSKNNLIPQTSTTTTNVHPSKSTTISLSFSSLSENEDLDNFKTTFKPGLFGSTTTKPSHMKPTIFTSQSRPQYFKPVPHSKPTPKTSQRPTFKPSPISSKPGTHLPSKPSLVTIENFLTLPATPSLEILPKPSSSAVNNGNISPALSSTTNGWFRPSIHASTKRPQYPTKISTSRKPQTTHASATKRPQQPTKVSTTKKPTTPSIAYSSIKRPQHSTKTSTTRRPQTTHVEFTNTHVSTKRPQYPMKTSPSRRPQTTHRTTEYPYVRPSWKPRPSTSGTSTISKPHVFTFSNYYSTRPTVSKTTQSSNFPASTSFQSTSPASIPVSVIKPTTEKVSTTKRPTVATSSRPIFSTTKRTSIPSNATTHHTFNVTMIPFFTTNRPAIQKPTASLIFNWFTPPSTKAPVAYNFTIVSSIVTVQNVTPSVIKPISINNSIGKPTKSPFLTTKTVNMTSVEEQSTTASSKQTTPFPGKFIYSMHLEIRITIE